MSVVCDCCAGVINKLNQQVSVMRKEIKNLRQVLDTAARTQRKHMLSIESAVSKLGREAQPPAQPSPASPQAALEQGNIQTVPIGYIKSCFSVKNATPRQPTICGPSRAELCIQRSVFANPEHALMGLEQYSHVWIIFLFHKNGHLSYKAKVKPPRLNGQRVGVYSTRSPHRPNVIGLTLAKLDKILGDTIYLSDIDMIAGTPVLDIKPYIPEYDYPGTRMINNFEPQDLNMDQPVEMSVPHGAPAMPSPATDVESNPQDARSEGLHSESQVKKEKSLLDKPITNSFSQPEDPFHVLEEVKTYVTQSGFSLLSCETKCRVLDQQKTEPQNLTTEHPSYGEETYSTISDWIRHPPVTSLHVRFTPHAQKGLAEFFPSHMQEPCKSERIAFKFLRSLEEAAAAIKGVLSADPRSVYRRKRCKDRLFFFTLDTAHITCWFGQDFVEVLQVQPVERQIALK